MRKLYRHPLFLFGLALRLTLIFIAVPISVTNWYSPFLEASIAQPTLDPWSVWTSQGGTPAAFPYGYAMWLTFLPLTLLCKLTEVPAYLGYAFTLLVIDLYLLTLFKSLFSVKDRLLLTAYWLSPIVLIASYLLGFNDLVPVFFLTLSIYFTRQLKLFTAGVFCVAAISAKFSMVLALPFFAIYFLQSRALHKVWYNFLIGVLTAIICLLLPFIFSSAGMQMLFSNPEMVKAYLFALIVGNGVSVYVMPLVYLLIVYGAWRVRRMNFELFQSILGIAFLIVVLLTPASPGWFIWVVPLLVSYQAASDKIAMALSASFSIFYLLNTLSAIPSMPFRLHYTGILLLESVNPVKPHVTSLLHTAMVAIGIVLALRIWREMISRNDYFRLSRRPFAIGIAGDSGSGKDTLSNALQGLFGSHSVVSLSGDDYHLWDRKRPIWQVMTHLNPIANDLERFAQDLVSLINGKPIMLRHYDHKTGIKSKHIRVNSNDFIIVSGLHTLYLPIMRSCLNLSIYLDIDEKLRRHLKRIRDVTQRGHSVESVQSQFAKREPDSERFIRPQAAAADLVLSLNPIHPSMLADSDNERPLRFKLIARSRNGLNELSLTRVLVGVCGLHVDMTTSSEDSEVVLTIEGETSAEDVAMAAKMLCPRALEFLDIKPKWADGVLGLMQLITLSHINQALTKRFL